VTFDADIGASLRIGFNKSTSMTLSADIRYKHDVNQVRSRVTPTDPEPYIDEDDLTQLNLALQIRHAF
jgi:hypothetical protein